MKLHGFFVFIVVALVTWGIGLEVRLPGAYPAGEQRFEPPVKLPLGMNLGPTNYWTTAVPFNDLMKTASKMITFDVSGEDQAWDTGLLDQIPRGDSGYPLALPITVLGKPQGVRILVNNSISGEYVMLYEGQGEYSWHNISSQKRNGRTSISCDGKGGHMYLQISRSAPEDPLRNIRIIPLAYADREEEMPLFYGPYLAGLRPFHCLRFMEWAAINNSTQVHWADRSRPDFYSQGLEQGISLEYAIDLANEIGADGWFSVPHMASDDYIRQMARLIRDRLDWRHKCYIEYSNETWNGQFDQTHWIINNGIAPQWPEGFREDTRSVESAVSTGLAGINAEVTDLPEKSAFLMARTFRIFSEEFGDQQDRLVRVAAVQQAGSANTGRILKYLFAKDGNGCDALAAAGYFGFGQDDHERWRQMPPGDVTAEMVLEAVERRYAGEAARWTSETAGYAREYRIDYLVYEGGQHIQPRQQQDWPYNQALWEAQVHPKMYQLYLRNFTEHSEPQINCKLFMAYCYLGVRRSRFGSWGHLESPNQAGAVHMLDIAPKYQALLDVNEEKNDPVW
jgi:hypothetical protein